MQYRVLPMLSHALLLYKLQLVRVLLMLICCPEHIESHRFQHSLYALFERAAVQLLSAIALFAL